MPLDAAGVAPQCHLTMLLIGDFETGGRCVQVTFQPDWLRPPLTSSAPAIWRRRGSTPLRRNRQSICIRYSIRYHLTCFIPDGCTGHQLICIRSGGRSPPETPSPPSLSSALPPRLLWNCKFSIESQIDWIILIQPEPTSGW